ncbi:lipocalin family protein [Oxalobacteraceae bacterium]|nr:lipocalin family protein [Oxalobacteraceae bacterium]
MTTIHSRLSALLLCCASLAAGASHADDASTEAAPLAAIASLDVPRYMGTWYEIARFPNSFQKKCVGFATASYSLNPEGKVDVLNRCKMANGQSDQAMGDTRQIGGASSAKLQVRFAPSWMSMLPMVWGDYWVIDLDADYKLAAVSEPKRKYLWILSRTTTVDPQTYAALLQRLSKQGFDISKLETTRQTN